MLLDKVVSARSIVMYLSSVDGPLKGVIKADGTGRAGASLKWLPAYVFPLALETCAWACLAAYYLWMI